MARKSTKKSQVSSALATPPPLPAEESMREASASLTNLNDVYRYASDFSHDLGHFPGKIGNAVMGKLETELVNLAFGLHDSLAKVIPDGACIIQGLPPLLERALKALRRRFLAWLDQFGWMALVSPDRKGYFAERCERYRREIEAPYYQAMLDWHEAIPEDDEPWNYSFVFDAAEEARRLGLTPTPGVALEEARARATELNERRFHTPVLGKIIPSFTEEEMTRFLGAVHVLADYVGKENWKALPANLELETERVAKERSAAPEEQSADDLTDNQSDRPVRGVPFLAIDGRTVEGFFASEAEVHPLHSDRSHPVDPENGYRVLISWRGRWIEAVVIAGDIVDIPPIRADSPTFSFYRNAREINAADASLRFVANGWFPPIHDDTHEGQDPTRAAIKPRRKLFPCEKDCLEVIPQGGKTLGTEDVFQALDATGKIHGKSTIKKALAYLVKAELLMPPGKGRGARGYGRSD